MEKDINKLKLFSAPKTQEAELFFYKLKSYTLALLHLIEEIE